MRGRAVPEQLSLLGGSDPVDQSPTANGDLPDQSARDEIATVLDRTLFVEAGAGSGKTRALVDRVESLIAAGVEIDHIAAITFTEKAAAELRDRIRHRLESPSSQLGAASLAARQQLDGAAVGTLHAFAQRILGEFPVEAGLPPGVEVLDEIGSQIEFETRWRGLLDRLLEDNAVGHSLLVLELSGVRIDHLRSLAIALGANWDLVEEHLGHLVDPPQPANTNDVLSALTTTLELRSHCTNGDDLLLARLDELAHLGAALTNADELDRLEAVAAIEARSKVGNVGAKGNWSCSVADVRDAVVIVRTACERVRERAARSALDHVVSVLAQFTLEAADERQKSGRLEFHDLLVLARRLLRDSQNGSYVRYELRQRYRYLLLDEFQDTDPIQIELAILLASAVDHVGSTPWTEIDVEPGRLFFVGDPKQSIYRFRRADIATFLKIRARFGDGPTLTTNFRSVEPIISWVNNVFGRLITAEDGSQAPYTPLDWQRRSPPVGPALAVIGADEIDDQVRAPELRRREAADVAAAVSMVLRDRWSVDDSTDPTNPQWRAARAGDIAILLPARTSLASIEQALDQLQIPHRADTSSLVYATREVRDVLMALRAISDPTDELAVVAALRSPLYGCGDDDLAHWKLGRGGRFSLYGQVSSAPGADIENHPVADGLSHLSTLHEARLWSTPSELLDRLIRERGFLESAIATGRPRDVWRRLRFVVDQARAWADAGGTDLRSYLEWARLQGADNARVSETVLPETDDDSVRILTIHGSKGLEFPVTIVAGTTTRLTRPAAGPSIAFPPGDSPAIRLNAGVQSESFERWQPIDEQMDDHERIRMLYVACTRARDHLIVSLRRSRKGTRTAATVLAEAGAGLAPAVAIEPYAAVVAAAVEAVASEPLVERSAWLSRRNAALAKATERTVIAATAIAGEAVDSGDPGLHKRGRNLELPPWNKGRYGTAVGRAVHGVLQVIDLETGAGVDDAARAQAMAEGVNSRTQVVAELARAALGSDVAREAAGNAHWRELWVAATIGERLVEGYVDLLYRSPGGLVVVDWKTDHVDGDDDIAAKLQRYGLQGASYAAAVEEATGEPVIRVVFVFLGTDGAIEAELSDLGAAMQEVRTRAAGGDLHEVELTGIAAD